MLVPGVLGEHLQLGEVVVESLDPIQADRRPVDLVGVADLLHHDERPMPQPGEGLGQRLDQLVRDRRLDLGAGLGAVRRDRGGLLAGDEPGTLLLPQAQHPAGTRVEVAVLLLDPRVRTTRERLSDRRALPGLQAKLRLDLESPLLHWMDASSARRHGNTLVPLC
ncbi:hypothetical protein D3C86_1683290 [compost metagenome]